MKKALSIIISIILILSLIGCSNGNIFPTAKFNYTTIYEQSELRWYISENYGENAVEKYCFYDLDELAEASFVVSHRFSKGDEPELLIRTFNSGLIDQYKYNNDILVSESSEVYKEIENIGTVYKLTMYGDVDSRNEYAIDSGPYYAFITYNNKGLLERIFLMTDGDSKTGTAGRYEYDQKGAVTTYYAYDYDTEFDEFFDSNYSHFEQHIYHYRLNKNSRLEDATIDYIRDGKIQSSGIFKCSYNSNGRNKTIETGLFDNTITTLEAQRQSNGNLISVQIYDENHDEEENFEFIYEKGGYCQYIHK